MSGAKPITQYILYTTPHIRRPTKDACLRLLQTGQTHPLSKNTHTTCAKFVYNSIWIYRNTFSTMPCHRDGKLCPRKPIRADATAVSLLPSSTHSLTHMRVRELMYTIICVTGIDVQIDRITPCFDCRHSNLINQNNTFKYINVSTILSTTL